MATSNTPKQPDKLERLKTRREIAKLGSELKQLSQSGLRFWVSSVGVPFVVALVTLIIFASNGIFDVHEKQLNLTKEQIVFYNEKFVRDTTEHRDKIDSLTSNINLIRDQKKKLADSLNQTKTILNQFTSLLKTYHDTVKGKELVLFQLANENVVLKNKLANEESNHRNASDSAKYWENMVQQSGRGWQSLVDRAERERNFQRDIAESRMYENRRLQDTISALKNELLHSH